jgi:hypothetical protein
MGERLFLEAVVELESLLALHKFSAVFDIALQSLYLSVITFSFIDVSEECVDSIFNVETKNLTNHITLKLRLPYDDNLKDDITPNRIRFSNCSISSSVIPTIFFLEVCPKIQPRKSTEREKYTASLVAYCYITLSVMWTEPDGRREGFTRGVRFQKTRILYREIYKPRGSKRQVYKNISIFGGLK